MMMVLLISVIATPSAASTLLESHAKALALAQSSQKPLLIILADNNAEGRRLLSALNGEGHMSRHAKTIVMLRLRSRSPDHKKLAERYQPAKPPCFMLVDPEDQAILRGPLSLENAKPNWKKKFGVAFQYVFEDLSKKQLYRAIARCRDANAQEQERLEALRHLVKSDFRESFTDLEKMLAEPDLGDEMAIALMDALSEFGEHGSLAYIIPFLGSVGAPSRAANAAVSKYGYHGVPYLLDALSSRQDAATREAAVTQLRRILRRDRGHPPSWWQDASEEQMLLERKAWDDYWQANRRDLILGAATRSP